MSNRPQIHSSAEIGEGVCVGDGTMIWHFVQIRPDVQIGENCILGRDVYIDAEVRIGNNVKIQNRTSIYKDCVLEDGVFVGPHVVFTNDRFPRSINPDGTLKSTDDWVSGSTHVGRGASIGAGSVILPSTQIGAFALIGAGSVVTKDVAPHEIVVGNPARLVGYACVCGYKLGQSEGDRWECPSCSAQYVFSDSNGCELYTPGNESSKGRS